jgi:hypothetical protein
MDLTHVATKPVMLHISHKVLYSVHEYPWEVGGKSPSHLGYGPTYINYMNEDWGYLIKRNIAPVWIGEMGASMKPADETDWAKTLLDYMDGVADDGPRFTGNRQPISGSWWVLGSNPGWDPDGNQTKAGIGNYKPAQLAVTDRMLMRSYGSIGARTVKRR